MCSVSGSELEEGVQCMEDRTFNDLNVCKKCNNNVPEVILQKRDAYCKDCFLVASNHKFRAALGKTKLVRPGDRVLIAFSGGVSSMALMHLIQKGFEESAHKQLRFLPHVLYIDENGIFNQPEVTLTSNAEISDYLLTFSFPAFATSISQALAIEPDYCQLPSKHTLNTDMNTNLLTTLDNIKTPTAKVDFLHKLRQNLIISVAKMINCSFIFIGDVGTDIATTLMSNIALGRGAHLSYDVGFCDARDTAVKILRPMKDFMSNEVGYYNGFHNIRTLKKLSFSDMLSSSSTIQAVTKRFISQLQDNFPATVFTVCRTGDKLSGTHIAVNSDECCAFCQAPLDTKNVPLSALQATEYSRMISSTDPKSFEGLYFPNTVKNNSTSVNDVEELLCYGCRLVSRDFNNVNNLPETVLAKSKIRQTKDIRKEIDGFLL